MEKAPGTGGMPGWLKGLLIAFAVFAVLGTVAVVGGLFFVGKVAGDMQNPTKIRTIASSFMKVSEPLPTGFDFKFGFDFAGNKLVAVMNSDKDLTLIFGQIQDKNGDLKDPDKVIEKLSAAPSGGSVGNSRSKFEPEKEGSETVGGRKMSYVLGHTVDKKSNRKVQTFIGLFEPTAAGTVMVLGTSSKADFDMAATDEVLKHVASI